MTSQLERTSSSCLRVLSSEGGSRSFQSLRGIRESTGVEVRHRVTSTTNYREVRPSPSSPLFLRLASWHDRVFKSFPSCWTRSIISERSGHTDGRENGTQLRQLLGESLLLRWPAQGSARNVTRAHLLPGHRKPRSHLFSGPVPFSPLCSPEKSPSGSSLGLEDDGSAPGTHLPTPSPTLRDQGLSPASSSCL